MSKRLALHVTAGIVSLLIQAVPLWAESGVAIYPVPPVPPPAVVDKAALDLGNPLNKPITGAAQVPAVAGGERPPSLETLQAARAGATGPGSGLEIGREEVLHQAGLRSCRKRRWLLPWATPGRSRVRRPASILLRGRRRPSRSTVRRR